MSLSATGASSPMLVSRPGIAITSNSPAKARARPVAELLALDRGQEADRAEVERRTPERRVSHVHAHRLEDRAVAAQHQAEVGLAVEVVEQLDPGGGVAVLGDLVPRGIHANIRRLRRRAQVSQRLRRLLGLGVGEDDGGPDRVRRRKRLRAHGSASRHGRVEVRQRLALAGQVDEGLEVALRARQARRGEAARRRAPRPRRPRGHGQQRPRAGRPGRGPRRPCRPARDRARTAA